ncbi:PKD domain-containing protein [Halobaculum sp. MBLA0147]|uniref:PKD domain-containing protein n=1 Tax=Halobaculum sp. MBLA0147 TaxID=3079934 RepID=UPI0035244DAD
MSERRGNATAAGVVLVALLVVASATVIPHAGLSSPTQRVSPSGSSDQIKSSLKESIEGSEALSETTGSSEPVDGELEEDARERQNARGARLFAGRGLADEVSGLREFLNEGEATGDREGRRFGPNGVGNRSAVRKLLKRADGESAAPLRKSETFNSLDNETRREVLAVIESISEQQDRAGQATSVVPVTEDTSPATVVSLTGDKDDYNTLNLTQKKTVEVTVEKTRKVEETYDATVNYTTTEWQTWQEQKQVREVTKTDKYLGWQTRKYSYDYPAGWNNWKGPSIDERDARNLRDWAGLSKDLRVGYPYGWFSISDLTTTWDEGNSNRKTEVNYYRRDCDEWQTILHNDCEEQSRSVEILKYQEEYVTKTVNKSGYREVTKTKVVQKTRMVNETYTEKVDRVRTFNNNLTTTAADMPTGGSDSAITLTKRGELSEFVLTVGTHSLPLAKNDRPLRIVFDTRSGPEWISLEEDKTQGSIVIRDDEGNSVTRPVEQGLKFNFVEGTIVGKDSPLDVGLGTGEGKVVLENTEGVVGSFVVVTNGTDMASAEARSTDAINTSGGVASAKFKVTYQSSGTTVSETITANPSYGDIVDDEYEGVENLAPVPRVSVRKTVVLGPDGTASTTAVATGSNDPDGSVSSYQWQLISGPSSATIATPNEGVTPLIFSDPGEYTFKLIVTDNEGKAASKTVTIKVVESTNQVPTVSITGDTRTPELDSGSVSTTLTAQASDPDGSIVDYSWSVVSGDASAVSIASPGSPQTSIEFTSPGTYKFRVTVKDSGNPQKSASATTVVSVPDGSGTVPDPGDGPGDGGGDGPGGGTGGGSIAAQLRGPSTVLASATTPPQFTVVNTNLALDYTDDIVDWSYEREGGGFYSVGGSTAPTQTLPMPTPGTWTVSVTIDGPDGRTTLEKDVEVLARPSASVSFSDDPASAYVTTQVRISGDSSEWGSVEFQNVARQTGNTGIIDPDPSSVSARPRTVTATLTDVKNTGDAMIIRGQVDISKDLDIDNDGLKDVREYNGPTEVDVADTDGDGLLDGREVELMPTSATDPDTDDDGVNDQADVAPVTPEDEDSFEPNPVSPDGKPETDWDSDGIPDRDDKCPTQAETDNGFNDLDGCPDEVKKKQVDDPYDGISDGIDGGDGGVDDTTDYSGPDGGKDVADLADVIDQVTSPLSDGSDGTGSGDGASDTTSGSDDGSDMGPPTAPGIPTGAQPF